VTNTGGKMDVFVNADGGGPTGQTGAIVMGLGRALAKYDNSLEGPAPQRRLPHPRQPHEGTQEVRPARRATNASRFSKR
jgi:small subunit ribosomal protein S9